MTRVLVFGKTGQVACALARQLAGQDAVFLARADADLSDSAACVAALQAHAPRIVINAAAYTAVDRAEAEEPLAATINAETPGALAQAAAARDIPFVHISTDYVFDGHGETPFTPADAVAPQSAYGRTKLAGEDAVRAAGGRFAILRTSWVFSADGANFVKTMLRLGAERDRLTIVADQIGGPTSAQSIAAACLTIAETLVKQPENAGTYHFSGGPDVSWADFAREIFVQAGLDCTVEDIPTEAYPTPAIRPRNSRLDCTSTFTSFGLSRPDWRDDLSSVLKDLT